MTEFVMGHPKDRAAEDAQREGMAERLLAAERAAGRYWRFSEEWRTARAALLRENQRLRYELDELERRAKSYRKKLAAAEARLADDHCRGWRERLRKLGQWLRARPVKSCCEVDSNWRAHPKTEPRDDTNVPLQALAHRQGLSGLSSAVALVEALKTPGRSEFVHRFLNGPALVERPTFVFAFAQTLKAQAVDPAFRAVLNLALLRAHNERRCFSSLHQLYLAEVAADAGAGLYGRDEIQLIERLAATASMRIGDNEGALRIIDSARAPTPALTELKARLHSVTNPAAALRLLDAASSGRTRPTVSSLLTKADISLRLGDSAEAESALDLLNDLNPHADANLSRAEIARRAGNVLEQREWVTRYFECQGLWSPANLLIESGFDLKGISAHPLPSNGDGPLVTVVMAAHNAAAHLDLSVRSVLRQTHRRLELIIVEDASQDRTVDIGEALMQEDSRILLLRNDTNLGPYLSRNKALSHARGEFVTFHDADDWAHPERLARHVDLMTARPELMATQSRWARITAEGAFVLKPWGFFTHDNPASTMYRARIFREEREFDAVRTGGDSEFWGWVHERYGHQAMARLDLTLAIGLHHPQSLTNNGAGAFDQYGVNLVRLEYWERWRQRHVEMLESAAKALQNQGER